MSVRLDAKTERLLSRLAREKGQTKSAIVREAIASLGRNRPAAKRPRTAYDALRPWIGCVAIGGRLSENTGEKFRRLLQQKIRARHSR